jgi:hypothetical protein
LATAIAWQIPVITTTIGRRGYIWKEGDLTIADDPTAFARECVDLLSLNAAKIARLGVVKVAETSPTTGDVATRMRILLGLSK